MSDAILSQILTVTLIIAVIVLIAVLWRAWEVLGNLKVTTAIVAKRVEEIDRAVEETKETVNEVAQAIKSFLYSFGFIKQLIDNFMKSSSNSKKEKDE